MLELGFLKPKNYTGDKTEWQNGAQRQWLTARKTHELVTLTNYLHKTDAPGKMKSTGPICRHGMRPRWS
jgi:hypothetical protein